MLAFSTAAVRAAVSGRVLPVPASPRRSARRRPAPTTHRVAQCLAGRCRCGLASRVGAAPRAPRRCLDCNGAPPDAKPERDAAAAAELQLLTKEPPTLRVVFLSGPARPTLIWDSSWVESTFDWLGH